MPQAILTAAFVKNVAIGIGTRIEITIEAPWRPVSSFRLRESDDAKSNQAAFSRLKDFLVDCGYVEAEDG